MAESGIITTPRLTILPFTERHLTERYIGWLKDPEAVRYSEQRFCEHTLETCRSYWQSFDGTPNYFWAIETKGDEPSHIGNINAYVIENHGLADIGILIGERAVWGEGYGSEAWIGVCDYLLRKAGLRKVTAGILSINVRALGMVRAAGWVKEGRRFRHYVYDGKDIDLVLFAMLREDWLKKHPGGPFSE